MIRRLFSWKLFVQGDGQNLVRGQPKHQKFGKLKFRKTQTSVMGQSLMEILIAIAVGVIMIGAATVVIVPALKISTEVNEEKVGAGLGRALFENVRVFGEASWSDLYNLPKGSSSLYYLTTSTTPFETVTGTESILVSTTTYIRSFYIDDACRDWSGGFPIGGDIELSDCSGGGLSVSPDPSTFKVTIDYSWAPDYATKTFSSYLTRYKSQVLKETDWSAGWILSRDPVTNSDGMFSTSSNIDFSTNTPGSLILILEE